MAVTGPGSAHKHTVSGKATTTEAAHTHSMSAIDSVIASISASLATANASIATANAAIAVLQSESAELDARVSALESPAPPPTGPLNDPQPDVSGIPVPAGFAAGTMTMQEAVDAAPAGSILNLAVNRTVNEGLQITKPLTIVFGVAGGPQLTITRPDPTQLNAIISFSDDVRLYRPRLRGIGVAVGVTPPQVSGIEGGAIQLGGAWKGGVNRNEIVNADISDVRMDGIFLTGTVGSPAVGTRISACLIARTGRNGVTGGGGEDFVNPPQSGDWRLARSKVTNTNLAGYDPGESAACVKWLWLSSALVEDNEFGSTNQARGFWTDTMVTNLIFRRNRVHDTMSGVFLESTHYVEAYDNVIWNNARNVGWGWGGGITLASSDHCDIHDNTIYRCGSGVTVVSQQRGDTQIPVYGGTVEINIHDNTIIEPDIYGAGWVQDWAGNLFSPGSNNRGSLNLYFVTAPEGRFAWNDADISTLAVYNSTPVEEGGRYLTPAERDAALVVAGL